MHALMSGEMSDDLWLSIIATVNILLLVLIMKLDARAIARRKDDTHD